MIRNLFISIMLITTAVFANSLSLEDNGDGTWNVGYTTDTAIGGFQFNVDDATIIGASGGDSASNGFMVSTSSSTVIGFSLTGATIPAGDHVLVYLNGDATSDEGCLEEPILSTIGGNPFDVVVGDCIDLDYVGTEAYIGFGNMTDNGLEVVLSNSVPLAGFQFDVSGFSVSSASGGAADQAGFQISNSTSTVLGFSLTGATIPAGDHVLVYLNGNATSYKL